MTPAFKFDHLEEEERKLRLRHLVRDAQLEALGIKLARVAELGPTEEQVAEAQERATKLAAQAKKQGVEGPYLYKGDKENLLNANVRQREIYHLEAKFRKDAGLQPEINSGPVGGRVKVEPGLFAKQKAAMLKLGAEGPPESEDEAPAPPHGGPREGII